MDIVGGQAATDGVGNVSLLCSIGMSRLSCCGESVLQMLAQNKKSCCGVVTRG